MINIRLVDIEKKIKLLIAEDIENPEVYTTIYDLSFRFLRRKSLMNSYSDAEEVAHIMAEELYLKVYRGGTITSWIGYINRSYHAYIRIWKKMNGSELIDTSNDYELEKAIVYMNSSIRTMSEYQEAMDNVYFESIPKAVDYIMSKSKYNEDTLEYMNSKLSILLSLCSNKFISYNQRIEDEMYTRILYVATKDHIAKSINVETSETGELNGGLTMMQLFTLSNVNTDR